MQDGIGLSKKLHILFVDDERLIREMVSDMLSHTVGHISLAANGQEGLDFYLNSLRPIDIVISDQTMPLLNGLDMLAKIKEHNPSQKCIMITAHSEAKYMLRAIEIGVEHFIIKPVVFDKLDAILYDLALKIEQEASQKEQEKLNQRRQIEHAFNASLISLVNNIPLPSLILNHDDYVITGNSELLSIFAGTPLYKKFMRKELCYSDIICASENTFRTEPLLCDWKEEFLVMEEESNLKIEENSYRIKMKRILSDENIRFYLLCLVEIQND